MLVYACPATLRAILAWLAQHEPALHAVPVASEEVLEDDDVDADDEFDPDDEPGVERPRRGPRP